MRTLSTAAAILVFAVLGPPQADLAGSRPGEEKTVAGVKLCWCPPGRFTMGSPPGEPGRRPGEDQAEVRLTRGFWAGKYEVTQGDWTRVVGKLSGPPSGRRREVFRRTSRRGG